MQLSDLTSCTIFNPESFVCMHVKVEVCLDFDLSSIFSY